jgi:hypothetical protein
MAGGTPSTVPQSGEKRLFLPEKGADEGKAVNAVLLVRAFEATKAVTVSGRVEREGCARGWWHVEVDDGGREGLEEEP